MTVYRTHMSSTETYWEGIAADIRAEMARQHKTGVDLGKVLHLSRNSTYRRLNGKIPFNLQELERVSGWLGKPVTEMAA